ncbi:hypothetical protein [Saccharothrix sp. HUAS TT1]|uniref:hypothetical protein n=1 Tax=unclassified Saccharothrix TaxID=2593673 RepID=UPI00345BCB8E
MSEVEVGDGYAHLYQTGWSPERVAQRVASLQSAGGTLENPDTGLILVGEFDDRNEPIPAERDQLVRALELSDRDSQFVTLWLGAPNDLWYVVRRVSPDVVVEEFGLSGFRQPEPFVHSGVVPEMTQDEVIHLVLGWMGALGSAALGLLADRWGSSLEIDLDDVVLGGPTPVTIRPDLLVLQPQVADRHPELADWGRRPHGRFTAFDPTGILDR